MTVQTGNHFFPKEMGFHIYQKLKLISVIKIWIKYVFVLQYKLELVSLKNLELNNLVFQLCKCVNIVVLTKFY